MRYARLFIVTLYVIISFSPVSEAFGRPKKLRSLAVTVADAVVQVRWESKHKHPDALTVVIERGVGDVFASRMRTGLAEGETTDTTEGLPYAVACQYRARVVDEKEKESKWVYSNSFTLPKPRYVAPRTLLVEQGDGGMEISWDPHNQADAAFIIVERQQDDADFTYLSRVAEESGTYFDATVEDGGVYQYRVHVAEDDRGQASEMCVSDEAEYAVLRFNGPEEVHADMHERGVTISWRRPSVVALAGPFSVSRPRFIHVERSVNGGAFARIHSVPYSMVSVIDRDMLSGEELVGSEGEYQLRGNTYQYRVRFEGEGAYAASRWHETEPVIVAQRHFSPAPVSVVSDPAVVMLQLTWDDVHTEKDPLILIERKEEDAEEYQNLGAVREGEKSYVDSGVREHTNYSYRITWQQDGDINASVPVVLHSVGYVSPAYASPEEVRAIVNDSDKKSYVSIVWVSPHPEENPALAIERSMNSRDYEAVGTARMHDQVYRDAGVTSAGGFVRKHLGKQVRMNVYRYRVRCLGGGAKRDSEWIETDDNIVYDMIAG